MIYFMNQVSTAPQNNNQDNQDQVAVALDNFLNDVIRRAGGEELAPELRQFMKQQLLFEIEKRLRVETLAALTPQQLNKYTQIIASQDKPMDFAEQIALFEELIPNYAQLMERTLEQAADEFVNLVRAS